MFSGPEKKEREKAPCHSSCVLLGFSRFPRTQTHPGLSGCVDIHLMSTASEWSCQPRRRGHAELLPGWLCRGLPTSTRHYGPSLLSPPPRPAPSSHPVPRARTPLPARGLPHPLRGAQRPDAHTQHTGPAPPERHWVEGHQQTCVPPPIPDLSSDPNPQPSWSPRRLRLLPSPTTAAALAPPREHLLPGSKMAIKVGEAGGEHSPTHPCITPLPPQAGPLSPSHSLGHVALRSSAFVSFHAQPLPGPINTAPTAHPFQTLQSKPTEVTQVHLQLSMLSSLFPDQGY